MPLITARVYYNIYTYQVCITVTDISLVDYRHCGQYKMLTVTEWPI